MSETMVDRVALAIMREENPDSRDQYRAMALAVVATLDDEIHKAVEAERHRIMRAIYAKADEIESERPTLHSWQAYGCRRAVEAVQPPQ